jgi:PIN domain nuclease of toxin-antitoxin system
MKYLLDTHVFLWAYAQSDRLPKNVAESLRDITAEVYLSAVTFWEIAIKMRSGRLTVGDLTASDLLAEAQKMDMRVLALEASEAAAHQGLAENSHFDPFDRMLIWQAISGDLTLVSADREFQSFQKYGLKLLWK